MSKFWHRFSKRQKHINEIMQYEKEAQLKLDSLLASGKTDDDAHVMIARQILDGAKMASVWTKTGKTEKLN